MDHLKNSWRRVRLGDLLEEHEERCGIREDLPLLSITKARGMVLAADRFTRGLHSKDKSRYRIARRDEFVVDPMLLWDGQVARQKIVEAGLVSPDYRVFRSRADVDLEFLEFALRSPRMKSHYRAFAKGTNVRRSRIGRADFDGLPVFVPSLSEQREIATVLSSIDTAIEKTGASAAQVLVAYRSIREALIVRGIPGRHRRFRLTVGGEMPAAWAETRLGDELAEPIRNGHSPVCPDLVTGKWILTLGAVSPSGFEPTGVKPAPSDYDRVEAASLRSGDVLVSRSNTRERVGLAGVYRSDPPDCSYPDLLMRVRPSSRLLPEYLEALLLSERGRRYFMKRARGTSGSMVKVNREIVEAFPVALPSLPEQLEIVEVLSSVNARSRTEKAVLSTLRELKTTVADLLLTGTLDRGLTGLNV